jgi:hypothetical protein
VPDLLLAVGVVVVEVERGDDVAPVLVAGVLALVVQDVAARNTAASSAVSLFTLSP